MIYLNDHIKDFNFDAALPLLSDERRLQALRFRHELGRKTCAAAYLLLREGLAKEYGITEKPCFDYGPHGKPVLRNHPDIHFNLSHCREAVVCALSDEPVGVDVEAVTHYKESVARYTMNEQELSAILGADRPEVMFTRLWTRKEAVLKLTGEGLRDNLKTVLDDVTGLNIKTIVSPDQRYCYSVASRKRDKE
jgi:4'-phosphopantetheinyl transferase